MGPNAKVCSEPSVVDGFDVDLAFIGAGVSSAYTLLGLIDELLRRHPGRPLRTAVVERYAVEYGGVPYGSRSGPASLIITSLRDFLPEPERTAFVDWLRARKDRLLADLAGDAGRNTRRWLAANKQSIDGDNWLPLYVPRQFFGHFIDERVKAATSAAEAAGLVRHQLIHDEVIRLDPFESGYQLIGKDRAVVMSAHHVVLCVGSIPPQRRFCEAPGEGVELIDDLYSPSLPSNVDRVRRAVEAIESPQVLVLGTNASSIEALYVLSDSDDPGLTRATFHVMSPGGRFPEWILETMRDVEVSTPALDALTAGDLPFTANQVYAAACDDLRAIRVVGQTVAESLPATARAVSGLLGRLDHAEKLNFAARWGGELGKMQRRAGGEYADNIEQLLADGRLTVVQGVYRRMIAEAGAGRIAVEYETPTGNCTTSVGFHSIINCAGFSSTLEPSGSPVVAELIASGRCTPVWSGSGLVVSDDMEAAPGLYVLGALLAGNVVDGSPVWHMEHCGRIWSFANTLAATLRSRLLH